MKIYEEETGLTNFTKEERIANLEKAMQMRKERAELRSQLASGVLTVSDLINLAERGDKAASGMRVKQMISALPGYGFKKTQALMHALSIAESKPTAAIRTCRIGLIVSCSASVPKPCNPTLRRAPSFR